MDKPAEFKDALHSVFAINKPVVIDAASDTYAFAKKAWKTRSNISVSALLAAALAVTSHYSDAQPASIQPSMLSADSVRKAPSTLLAQRSARTAPIFEASRPAYPSKPSVKDLIAYAKTTPSKLNYASTGNTSLAHLAIEWFRISTGIELVHIPYKGVGAAFPDMLSGEIQMSLLPVLNSTCGMAFS